MGKYASYLLGHVRARAISETRSKLKWISKKGVGVWEREGAERI